MRSISVQRQCLLELMSPFPGVLGIPPRWNPAGYASCSFHGGDICRKKPRLRERHADGEELVNGLTAIPNPRIRTIMMGRGSFGLIGGLVSGGLARNGF